MQRIIKDGIYVKKEYNKEQYWFKSKEDALKINPMIDRNRLIVWNDETFEIIHSANLLGSREKVLPPALEKQKELYYLTIPSQLTKYLNEAVFLDELRGLQIEDGNLKLKETTIWRNLIYLSIGGNIFFKKENLPALRTIVCNYRVGLIDELCRYDMFDKLTLQTVNFNVFEEIKNIKSLYGLQILRGKLNSIKGISSIKSLHWLSLDILPQLNDINELMELKYLEKLEIGYCKHIQNWDFLLRIKTLKELTIVASSYKDYPPQKILDNLRNKGVVVPMKGS